MGLGFRGERLQGWSLKEVFKGSRDLSGSIPEYSSERNTEKE